jgi:hypothetical protein
VVDAAFHGAVAKGRDIRHDSPVASDSTSRPAAADLDDRTRAEIERENKRLIAAMKRHLRINFDDPGNAGVPNVVFLAGWDGFDWSAAAASHIEDFAGNRAAVACRDAVHEKIAREMSRQKAIMTRRDVKGWPNRCRVRFFPSPIPLRLVYHCRSE